MEVYEYLIQDLEVVVVVIMLNVPRCCRTNLSLKYSVTTRAKDNCWNGISEELSQKSLLCRIR